jgi:glutamate 5-kinase
MRNYSEALRSHGLVAAQVLLTMDDMVHRQRYINVRNELELLLKSRVVPIINENDSVSVEGVTFVENDKLAAIVATKMKVDLLVFLSDQPGLCTGNPQMDPCAELIPVVCAGEELSADIGDAGGAESRGGMQAKLQAARTAAICGIPVVMADGREESALLRIVAGEEVGTYFVPGRHSANGKKPWLAAVRQPVGVLRVDAGAARALQQQDGASLLPRGIVETKHIVGAAGFKRGDLVSVVGPRGEIARGLSNYSSEEVRRIMGRHSSEISAILGYAGPEEVIHRDNLVMTAE